MGRGLALALGFGFGFGFGFGASSAALAEAEAAVSSGFFASQPVAPTMERQMRELSPRTVVLFNHETRFIMRLVVTQNGDAGDAIGAPVQ
jgi:hypothetical protein